MPEFMIEISSVFVHSIMITLFVFVMMMIVDYINVLTRGKISVIMHGSRFRQYVLASFLGAMPGCLGAFMNVSFYVRGFISFGAIAGGMIATSGDESYVMFAMFPKVAILLHILLFVYGIFWGWIIDRIFPSLKIVPCQECHPGLIHLDKEECKCFDKEIWKKFPKIMFSRLALILAIIFFLILIGMGIIGPKEWNWERTSVFGLLWIALFLISTVPDHYLKEHIWEHIVKSHIWRVFLWTLGTLLVIHIGLEYWHLEEFAQTKQLGILFLSALVGIIPESGPHLVFVTMFAKGLVPFSILLTSSIVQDGHGLLPLLSYSIKDTILIKIFNFAFGIGIGLILFLVGI